MRPYTHSGDINILLEHLRAGGRLAYYGLGDLAWRLAYELHGTPLAESIFLSENGWMILTPDTPSLDVYMLAGVAPAPWLQNALDRLQGLVPEAQCIQTEHVTEADTTLIAALTEQGFTRMDNVGVVMHCDLPSKMPMPVLPDGFFPRTLHGIEEAPLWGAACADAFNRPAPIDYARIMQSPLYDRRLDMVITAPDGEIAAFATGWLDPVTKQAQIEPAGTRQKYQRMGLGKVALWSLLRRLSNQGAVRAMLHTRQWNTAAQLLYQSVGFQEVMKVYRYQKIVKAEEQGQVKAK